jgi:hypothetical protein
MGVLSERVRALKDRLTKRGSQRGPARKERAQRKARAEALRREYQRLDMHDKIHRK